MISILKQNGIPQQNVCEFVVDSKDELSKIPKAVSHGSTCLVTKDGSVYILNGKKEWNPLTGEGSTSSNSMTMDEIQEYIDNAVANAAIASANIPSATQNRLGLVKGSSEITVASNGALQINAIDVNKIVFPNGTTVILDGGNSKNN